MSASRESAQGGRLSLGLPVLFVLSLAVLALLLSASPAEARRGGGSNPQNSPSVGPEDFTYARAAELYRAEPGDFTRLEEIDPAHPRFRVRLPEYNTFYDEPILAEARRRLATAFTRQLRVQDITVVMADAAEDRRLRDEEHAYFLNRLPRASAVLHDGLSELSRTGTRYRPTLAEIAGALDTYRGRVLIVAGHVEDGAMTWTSGGRSLIVDLQLWSAAAHASGAVLIFAGCNAHARAGFGSYGLLNSRVVVEQLVGALEDEPSSFGDLYERLTVRQGLPLVLNPFVADLSYEKVEVLGAADGITDLWSTLELPPSRVDGSRPCDELRNGKAFLACQPTREAALEVARAKELRWIAAGLYIAAIFLAAWPLALAQRAHDRSLPDDQSEVPTLARYYGITCLMLGPLHAIALAIAFPTWTITSYLAWVVIGIYLLALAIYTSLGSDGAKGSWLGALGVLISAGFYLHLVIASGALADAHARLRAPPAPARPLDPVMGRETEPQGADMALFSGVPAALAQPSDCGLECR